MILNLPYGSVNNRIWRKKLSIAGILLAGVVLAAPSPIEDEAFLLFLADSIEEDGEMIDPLTMIEETDHNEANENEQTANTEEADNE